MLRTRIGALAAVLALVAVATAANAHNPVTNASGPQVAPLAASDGQHGSYIVWVDNSGTWSAV